MPKEQGHVEYRSQLKKWDAIFYVGKKNVRLGRFDTRDEAVNELQSAVAKTRRT